jgi:hypothetical protein
MLVIWLATVRGEVPRWRPTDRAPAGDPAGGAPAADWCSAGASAGPWPGLALVALLRPAHRGR